MHYGDVIIFKTVDNINRNNLKYRQYINSALAVHHFIESPGIFIKMLLSSNLSYHHSRRSVPASLPRPDNA